MFRFRRLSSRVQTIDGVRVERWEIAATEGEMHAKLNGEMAEVIEPAKPWFVQLWRVLFPLRGTNG